MVPLRRLSQRARRSLEHHTSSSSSSSATSHQQHQHQHQHQHQPSLSQQHLLLQPQRYNPTESSKSFEWHDDRDKYIMTFPIHPLSAMQAPFEESMLDATGETGFIPFPNPNKSVEARQQLLCKDGDASELSWNFTYNCHWRNNPKGKFHPLIKIVAQIVFGVHLLHQHLEKSVADVADILLKHVNELDSFLQRANEDIEGSLKDMLFRRKCLKVPMEHVNEFDRLLEDRVYRAQLLDGNVTIERTITRMSEMLNDYLIDMSTFRDANRELDLYLLEIGDEWVYQNEDVGRIYSAMCGNTGGWSQFLQSLVAKAERLGVVLVQVSSYCNEIEKRCGAASRRSLIASRSSSRNSSNSREAARSFRNFANNKPLPSTPNERPPFIPSSSNGTIDSTPNTETLQRHPSTRHRGVDQRSQVRLVANSNSVESLRRDDNTPRSSGKETERTDVNTRPQHPGQRSEYDRDTSHRTVQATSRNHSPSNLGYTDEKEAVVHRSNSDYVDEKEVIVHRKNPSWADEKEVVMHPSNAGYAEEKEVVVHYPPHFHSQHPEASSQSGSDTTETMTLKRAGVDSNGHGQFGDQSPPMTGKDSAYSSLSGASFGSPTSAMPRSASSVSSHPRAQFGLFPSSSPSTPRTTMSGRHGSMSPAFASPLRTTAPATPSDLPERAQTSLDNYSSSSSSFPSRRLSKRASLTSIKRFFSKKKHGSVDTITE